ncbi:MAG: hypothetical protein P8X57_10820 [Cyclobacteriaceae bacterium]
MRYFLITLLFTGILLAANAQENPSFIFPDQPDWKLLYEGDTLSFEMQIADSLDRAYTLSYEVDETITAVIDSSGWFTWTPSYDIVDRLIPYRNIGILFEALFEDGEKLRQEVNFTVFHVNRPPVIEELPVFYVRWKPSRSQFREIRDEPMAIPFIVQDQPFKSESNGVLYVAPTQMDLPPEIVMVPNDSAVAIGEDEFLNLNFYLTDPNGDDDIDEVGFVANDPRLENHLFKSNTATQWEFKWMPGYDFVELENGTREVEITFFVLDKSNRRSERKLIVTVEDRENLDEKDQRLFLKYKGMLIEAMDLIAQLDDNQKTLNKELRKAKKGQRNRAIMNASLGAVTGVGPVFLEDPSKDYVTGIGGTAVMTMGTLEATDVIGRSKDDILSRMKLSIDIRNQLQTEGDQFARKYALKAKRRSQDFFTDIDKLKKQLNNKQLILLELDAGWKNPKRPTDNNIKKTFPDYNPEGFENSKG